MTKSQVWSDDGKQKLCNKCGQMRHPDSFRERKLKSGGFSLASWCLDCTRAYSLEKMNSRYRDDPEWREKKLARDRVNGAQKRAARQLANPRKLLTPEERLKRTRESHRKSARRPEYRERQRVRGRDYRALKKANAAGQNITKEEWDAVVAKHGGKCAYCGLKTSHLELDHVVPVSKGGLHTLDNVAPACRACNTSKGNRALGTEWTPPSEPQRELRVHQGRRAWKLTDEQVNDIRTRRASGESRVALAAKYGIHAQYVTDICGTKKRRE